MPEFKMSDSSYFDAPDVSLEHATFPHLTGVEWDAQIASRQYLERHSLCR
uniref:Uncharacterized protein n=1 Tax=Peronospora matthiolae TaxID=2874970 RepID=A0AAV1TRM4_9STRA